MCRTGSRLSADWSKVDASDFSGLCAVERVSCSSIEQFDEAKQQLDDLIEGAQYA